MHRSGTSAVTKILNILGCELPKTLMSAHESNEAGHWESDVLMFLNDEILSSSKSNWDDWTPVRPDWFLSPEAESFIEKAALAFKEEFGDAALTVYKDPRVCRLLPFWKLVFAKMETSPKFIIPLRNPIEVSDSLNRRDGSEQLYNQLLWLRHVLDAEAASRGYPRAFITYDDVMTSWSEVMTSVEDMLGISWPRQPVQVSDEIEAFLSHGLRHHKADVRQLEEEERSFAWVASVFNILSRWAKEGEDEVGLAALDDIRGKLNDAAGIFGNLILRGKTAIQKSIALKHDVVLLRENLESSRQEADSRIAVLETQLHAVSDSGWANIPHILSASQSILSEVNDHKAAIDQVLVSLDRVFAQTAENRTEVQADVVALRADSAALRDQFATAQIQVIGQISEIQENTHVLSKQIVQARDAFSNAIPGIEAGREATRELALVVDELRNAQGIEVQNLKDELRLLRSDFVAAGKDFREVMALNSAELDRARKRAEDADSQVQAERDTNQRIAEDLRTRERDVKDGQTVIAALQTDLNIERIHVATVRAELQAKSEEAVTMLSQIEAFMQLAVLETATPIVGRSTLRQKASQLKLSGIFDEKWYLDVNDDVAKSGMDPHEHYLRHGIREGRSPSRLIDELRRSTLK